MWLKPGCEDEYKQRHDEIWPEMLAQMQRNGIRNFTFDRYGLILFACLERRKAPSADPEPTDLTRRWWLSMAHLMETEADGTPLQQPVKEMFHL